MYASAYACVDTDVLLVCKPMSMLVCIPMCECVCIPMCEGVCIPMCMGLCVSARERESELLEQMCFSHGVCA